MSATAGGAGGPRDVPGHYRRNTSPTTPSAAQ